MSGMSWVPGDDDRDDDQSNVNDGLPDLADEPDRNIPDRYSSIDPGEGVCIYDTENHQAWVQSSVGLRLSDFQ